MKTHQLEAQHDCRGVLLAAFSLVEVLAAVALIGIITFLALPNIVRVKQDSEDNLAVARAEALNLAIASYIQANGPTAASTEWQGKTDEQRYDLVKHYLAFAPATLATYMPTGYTVGLPTAIPSSASDTHLDKASLTGPNGPLPY